VGEEQAVGKVAPNLVTSLNVYVATSLTTIVENNKNLKLRKSWHKRIKEVVPK